MGTTVKELKAYLDTLPDETEVEVIVQYDAGYDGQYGTFEALDLEQHVDFTDMTGNPFAKGKAHENAKTLYLGED